MELKYDIKGSKSKKPMCYNPVEQHLISLRKCSFELDQLIENAEEALEICKKENPDEERIFILPSSSIPEFPKNYPFVGTLSNKKQKTRIKFEDTLDEDEVEKLLHQFVSSVLIQTGYFVGDPESSDEDSEAVNQLADMTDRFLIQFVSLFNRNKYSTVFSESSDLWDPLETTLQEIGFHGLSGLHVFYYEKIVKKHDILLSHCIERLQAYEKLRDEYHTFVKGHPQYQTEMMDF